MWTRERNHMVYTEPWVYVALPGQRIEYMQMHETDGKHSRKHRPSIVRRIWWVYRALKRLTLL